MYHLTRLGSGLTVATAPMPHMASVSLGVWVGAGSRYEPAELNGASHFIEHLLFKGTRRRSPREISQAIEGVGGYLNAFTSEEATCVHARAGADRFEEMLEVLMDMLLHSVFAPVEIAKEREVIKEEIAMCLDEPQHHVQELLNATLWPGQPLGRSISGTPKTLDELTRRRLLGFLRRHYVGDGLAVVAAGNVSHPRALRALKPFVREIVPGSRPRFEPVTESQSAPRISLFTRNIEQTQMALGIRTCSRHDERRFALRLLNAILGENMSSRLFQVVREDRGLAYSIYSAPSFFQDTGDLVISAGLDTGNLGRVLRLIVREMRRFTEMKPSTAELRRARDYAIGQMELGHESTENQMNWVGEQLLGYGRVHSLAQVKNRLARVTGAEIRSVARDFFRPERLNLALVSPRKHDRGLLSYLRWQ